jgi:pyrimidine deaminase RibD-like protein
MEFATMHESLDMKEIHRRFSEVAVAQGKLSLSESRDKPLVGVVIARDGIELGRSFRGETGSGEHAEYALFKKLKDQGVSTEGATLYTTLEPCSKRNHPKIPCANHIVEAGITEVHIGIYDPNPQIQRQGWRVLRDSGVKLKDFLQDLRAEIQRDNEEFIAQFQYFEGRSGENIRFDYNQNGGRFLVYDEDGFRAELKFSACSGTCIYMTGPTGNVGKAKYARDFQEIDDPAAVDDWQGHSRKLEEGDIGILRVPGFFVLIKVVSVENEDYGDRAFELCFDFETRPWNT